MTVANCPGSQQPFVPETLSRDGEVAQCPSCGGNYYVTDADVIEPHPAERLVIGSERTP